MAVKPILIAGNPKLRTKSTPVELPNIHSQNIQNLIHDLYDTMAHAKGVGLAAPQIGVFQRVIVYGFEKNPRYPHEKPIPLTVMVNPVIVSRGHELTHGFEGCLSLTHVRGRVPRYDSLTVTAYSPEGQTFTKNVSGFEAKIIQHEIDHLDGLFFVERIHDFTDFGLTDELQAHGVF